MLFATADLTCMVVANMEKETCLLSTPNPIREAGTLSTFSSEMGKGAKGRKKEIQHTFLCAGGNFPTNPYLLFKVKSKHPPPHPPLCPGV